jgi:hypothetical protein
VGPKELLKRARKWCFSYELMNFSLHNSNAAAWEEGLLMCDAELGLQGLSKGSLEH